MRLAPFLALLSTVSCARPYQTPPPVPLNADEVHLRGCYRLIVEPWGGVGDSSSIFVFQLDSLGSSQARYLKVLSSPEPAYRMAYWNSTGPNAFMARLVWGVEGQGFSFQMRLTGDSLVGAAAKHGWPGDLHLAGARGAKQPCPVS